MLAVLKTSIHGRLSSWNFDTVSIMILIWWNFCSLRKVFNSLLINLQLTRLWLSRWSNIILLRWGNLNIKFSKVTCILFREMFLRYLVSSHPLLIFFVWWVLVLFTHISGYFIAMIPYNQKCWQCCTKEKTEQEKEVQLILKCDTTTKVASDLDCMRFIKINWFWFPDWSRARIFKAKKVSLVVFRKVCWHFFWIERWRLCFWNCWTNFPSLKPWCICR